MSVNLIDNHPHILLRELLFRIHRNLQNNCLLVVSLGKTKS